VKICWFSNSPLSSTGYGNQTKLFTPHLKNLGHEIEILAFHGVEPYTSPYKWEGMNIHGRGFHPYGMDVAVPTYMLTKSDILLSLMDAWIFEMSVIKQARWVPWFPIDHDPIPPEVLEKVRYAFARIVYSKFGEKQLNDYDLDCHYIPHGVNTKSFAPIPDAAREIGKDKIGIPRDRFVVGMVAANKGYPTRKAFEQNLMGFKKLYDKHNDALLFMQTWTGEGGNASNSIDLIAYCRAIGLQPGKNVLFCDQFMNTTRGFPDPYIVALYNAMDVLLSVSRGEGFGIPILEAQACGTPVITGDWTSMGELTFSGWKVAKSEAMPEITPQLSTQYIPFPDAIYERLEAAYQMRGNQDYRKRARKGAEPYDIEKITEKYWKPALESISNRIETVNKLKAQVAVPVQSGKAIEVKEING